MTAVPGPKASRRPAPSVSRRRARAGTALLGAVLLAGCTSGCTSGSTSGSTSGPGSAGTGGSSGSGSTAEGSGDPVVRLAQLQPTTVLDGQGAELATQASEDFFASSPVVVVATQGADLSAPSRQAEDLGVPLLLVQGPAPTGTTTSTGATTATGTPTSGAGPTGSAPSGTATSSASGTASSSASGTASSSASGTASSTAAPGGTASPSTADSTQDVLAEVQRLGVQDLVVADAGAKAWAQAQGDAMPDVDVHDGTDGSSDVDPPERAGEAPDVLALSTGDPADAAAEVTARAAGADVRAVPGGDPRADAELITDVSAAPADADAVVGLDPAFGPVDRLAERMDVVRTGVQLPGGGQLPFPGRLMVSLYGTPGGPSLGVLGEQDLDATIARAKEVAGQYDDLVDKPVVPAFDLITTVASSAAGADGDYSAESDPETLRPWVEAAQEAGIYVVLDLQPGRSDFLSQAKRYESLLTYPNVGLALDPEWRLKPDQRHLRQVGQVSVEEVNSVGDWLAQLTRDHTLPPKVFLLHQFQSRMIPDREQLDMSHDELQTMVHADGNGTPGQKEDTYRVLTQQGPDGLFWGWKNFYDEDSPTFTPSETMAVTPQPDFVSYQ